MTGTLLPASQILMHKLDGTITIPLAKPWEPAEITSDLCDILGVRLMVAISDDGSKFTIPEPCLVEGTAAIQASLNGGRRPRWPDAPNRVPKHACTELAAQG